MINRVIINKDNDLIHLVDKPFVLLFINHSFTRVCLEFYIKNPVSVYLKFVHAVSTNA